MSLYVLFRNRDNIYLYIYEYVSGSCSKLIHANKYIVVVIIFNNIIFGLRSPSLAYDNQRGIDWP